MNPQDIQAAIVKANTSQTAIAKHLGVSGGTVWRVINGRGRSARVEAELEKICGKHPFGAPAKKGRPASVWNGQLQAAA